MVKRTLLAASMLALAVSCGGFRNPADGGSGGGSGGGGGGSGGGDAGTDAGSDALNTEEQDTSLRGGDSSNALQVLSVLADSLYDFDPTIDPTRTALANAGAIEQNVRSNLGATDGGVPFDGGALGCGSVSLSTNTVTISFGAAPGCRLRNGTTISGTVAVTVTKLLNTIGLAMTMTQVVVNGKSIDGTATFSTNTGTTFTLDADVTSGTTRYQANNFSVSGSAGTVTLNGMLTVTAGTVSTSMTYNAVTWVKGDCYPNGGTLRTVKGLIATTITFNANTPTTGQVTVGTGRVTATMYLPSYGSCGVRDGG